MLGFGVFKVPQLKPGTMMHDGDRIYYNFTDEELGWLFFKPPEIPLDTDFIPQ